MSWTYVCSFCGATEEVDEATQERVSEKHKNCLARYEAEIQTLAYRIVGLLVDACNDSLRAGALHRARSLLGLP